MPTIKNSGILRLAVPSWSPIIERISSPSGELTVRYYDERDIAAHVAYLFDSPGDFLEYIGIDLAKISDRDAWHVKLDQRLAEARTKGEPAKMIVAELGGRTVTLASLDLTGEDGVPRLHFHVMDPSLRGKGLGGPIFLAGVRAFSAYHGYKRFFIEPKAANAHMNALMRKLGFRYLEDLVRAAGPITPDTLVSRYEILV